MATKFFDGIVVSIFWIRQIYLVVMFIWVTNLEVGKLTLHKVLTK